MSRRNRKPKEMQGPEPFEIMKMALRMMPMMLLERIPKKEWEADAKAAGKKGLEKELHIFRKKMLIVRELGDFLVDKVEESREKNAR